MHLLVFLILMAAAIIGFALTSAFLKVLRERHPAVWESLGEPSLFLNNSIANSLAVLRFLWRKDYEALNDPDFAERARVLRLYNILYCAFFGAIVVWQLAESFAHQRGR